MLQALVEVTVTDEDDETAHFDSSWYRFEVLENRPGGTVVGQVHAKDLDEPPFNQFHYRQHGLDTEDQQSPSSDGLYSVSES